MELTVTPVSPERFAKVKAQPDCVTYCENYPTAGLKQSYWISVYGLCTTAEIFVHLSDGHSIRVRCFVSRHLSCPLEFRREQLPLVDVADAFTLARTMIRRWGYRTTRSPFP